MTEILKERDERGAYIVPIRPSHADRAKALRDAVCQIFSSTGAYPHDIPRLCKEALERDNRLLDAMEA